MLRPKSNTLFLPEKLQAKKLKDKEGIVLFIVIGVVFVVLILAKVVLSIISSQSRLTHHQVSRIRAYYAAGAGMVYAIEQLRLGTWTPNPAGGANKYACLNGCIDAVTPTYTIPADADIPYRVQVSIYPLQSGINETTRLEIKTDYTYTP